MTRQAQGRVRERVRMWRAATAVAVVAALAAGCTLERDDAKRSSSGNGGRVLAVKIDNVGPARPQTGLDAADVVYVEQVEAGLSRLMAVYASKLPPVVGPVRSARETDLDLLRQFDRPALAFSGAQSKLLPLIDRAPLRPLPPGEAPDRAYYRGGGRPAPHNLYLRPAALGVKAEARGLDSTGFAFGPRPAGGTPETRRTVRFPSARFTFTWVEYEGRWHIAMDGTQARTAAGEPLTAATVVIQSVDIRDSRFHDRSGNTSPLTRSIGEGSARVLRDGRSYEARWERRAAADGTEFTTPGGKPLPFAKGPVWVVFTKA
ncbi:DUF3048 domain-containing protein [Streptomyces flavofungini]|uniref:DUF3048 domain-containing protein n=1 Tax=Streptomyces flavofungini TaxID=68200 RepID=UPI0025AF2668|nr:DUF3048 domain-containing protein [Streptomyces flavofungini]WJV45139.1 DUF3048 domain-containing protein [Streptomyces flavofungini]